MSSDPSIYRLIRPIVPLVVGLLFLVSPLLAIAGQHIAPEQGNPDSGPERANDEQQETILIDGNEYLIPPPWAGNKISAPTLSYDSFSQIPTEFTHQETKIYVRTEALEPLVDLLEHARQDGIELRVESGYRSERYQRTIFKRMMTEGRTFADIVRYVAPPGYSQHMLGTAVDFYPSTWDFADTPAYEWLKEKAGLFEFEESYPRNNKLQLPWEAWHWNYIGE